MTKGKKKKARVRERQAKTGESYQAAGMPHLRARLLRDGRSYLAMEPPAPKMTTLAALLEARNVTRDEASSITRRTAEALVRIHERGVVHRAIGPDTVYVCGSDGDFTVRLTSFTESSMEGEPALVRGPGVLAHPTCLAPELRRGGDGDARTDLFGLGVLLYAMLHGTLPRAKLAKGASGLERTCVRLLESDPNARFASATDLLAALDG